jgi:solute carrier family 8 (sodium/calcium exchanger)
VRFWRFPLFFSFSFGFLDFFNFNHLIFILFWNYYLKDTFASKVAAVQDKYADSSVGNVTGSNAVNVFLGIGIAWLAATIYHTWNGTKFYVETGSLAFSVTLFCIFAGVAIALMMIRRVPAIGGELGGPLKFRYITSSIFFGLWLVYLAFSALESYCIIKGF